MGRTIPVRSKCKFLEEGWSFGIQVWECSKDIQCPTCGHKKQVHNIGYEGCPPGCPDYKERPAPTAERRSDESWSG